MTTKLLDPNDTGEIPRLPGEDRTVIIRIDTGEKTQRLNPYLIPTSPFPIPLRQDDAVPESLVTGHGYDPEAHSGPIFDLVDTATIHIPQDDLAGPQLSLLGTVAGLDGELRPAPFPTPLGAMVARKPLSWWARLTYRGQHRGGAR
jgi:hypothetical protein